MWQYVFLLLRRQPGKSVLASSGFLLAACAFVLLSATTQTTVIQANQILAQNWRPTYDLVVLPPQASLAGQQNIPTDVLSGYNGGISLGQYQQIKKLPGIAVAAPIAYVGYLNLPAPIIRIQNDFASPGYYREEWTETSFNGQRQIVEQHNTAIIFLDGSSDCRFSPADANAWKKYNDRVAAYAQKGISYDCATNTGANSNYISLYSFHSPPINEKFLLAAIDPVAEDQLVNLDASIVKGRMLTEKDTAKLDPGMSGGTTISGQKFFAYHLPVITHLQLPGQSMLHLTYARLAADALTPAQVLARGGGRYLSTFPAQQVFINEDVPLVEHDPDLFSGVNLYWDGHSWQRKSTTNKTGIPGFTYPTIPSGLTYRPVPGPAGSTVPAYQLVPTGTQGPEVAFRDITHPNTIQKQSAQDVVTYYYDSVGQFTDTQLAAQFNNPLNWLPENTYMVPPTVLRYDAQGKPISPTPLLPTSNTAGYVIQPPLALTTLAAAQQMRGNNFISAIRVRVAGVNRADAASWKRIQQLASLIEQKTHLRVLVTLGSSPKPVLVYVSGVEKGHLGATQNIAPSGWVEEHWISVGAAIVYLESLGNIRFLLLSAVLAVCLGYLVVAFTSLVTAQRREFAILSALGWRPTQYIRLFLAQTFVLAMGGGFVGLGIALLITMLLSTPPFWPLVIWTLPAILLLALISSLYPLWQLWQVRPAEILRAGSSISSRRATSLGFPFWSFVSPIGVMVLRNLTRSRPRTVITMGSLFFSSILLVLMFSGILALRQTLSGTLLGDFVLVQTAIPQLAGSVFAMLLTFLSVADLLLLQVRERRKEIGLFQAIGWRPGQVQRLFVQEGLTLAILSTLPGVLIALWILSTLHTVQSLIPSPFIALGTILLMVLVAALASIPALRAINRLQISDVLRSE